MENKIKTDGQMEIRRVTLEPGKVTAVSFGNAFGNEFLIVNFGSADCYASTDPACDPAQNTAKIPAGMWSTVHIEFDRRVPSSKTANGLYLTGEGEVEVRLHFV